MDKCKVCGKEYQRLIVHLRTAHNMTMEEHDKYDGPTPEIEIPEEMTEQEAEAILEQMEEKKVDVSGAEKEENIFKPDKKIASMEEFLKEFDLSYKELRSIIKTYTKGSPLDVNQELERKAKLGKSGAEALKDRDKVQVTQLFVAEELVKHYGFEVTHITSDPKTWHLIKS